MRREGKPASRQIRLIGLNIAVWALVGLTGCLSPVAMHRAVLEYDRTVSRVEAEMLLLNIARARYLQPTHFTAISSVAATFDFRVNTGVTGVFAENPGTDAFSLTLGSSVAENPTVTIIPIQGEEFTQRILTPMDETKFKFLVHQGIEPAIILRLMVRGIQLEEQGGTAFFLNLPHRTEEYAEFRRRILHLSSLNLARQLHVGPLIFEETWPMPKERAPTLGEFLQASEKGYQWIVTGSGKTYALKKKVTGRIAITNYNPDQLPNEERWRLHESAQRHPRNMVLVDIRPDGPGGAYPFRGFIKLRSFNAIIEFLARGIADEPEFPVGKDPRTERHPPNPVRTMELLESAVTPPGASFSVEHEGLAYSLVARSEHADWNMEAFRVLNHLYQMTVTDVARVPSPQITISK